MQNDDKQRLGQPPIHTHLPDTVPPEDVKKIVGEPVPHGADYNSPPPEGAGKSMGSGLDDSVGGPTMGSDPAPRGAAATSRDQDSRAVDQHMGQRGNLQQGEGGNAQSASQSGGQAQPGGSESGGQGNMQRDSGSRSEGLLPADGGADGRYEVAEEVSLDQQSDQARRVGSMEEAAKGPHGDQLADAVARSLGKDGNKPS
ncbi:hypothetical protein [Massilia sp. METH4]|uniref:hypothetical protein n=1 Tax=Massilia sp. METH4 TaxID=3123041 RepID=UPI0030CF0324